MRLLSLPLFASLLLLRGADRDPAATAGVHVDVTPPPPAEALDEPAPAPSLPPPAATPLRETGAPLPKDLTYTVGAAKGGGLEVTLRRKDHLVAMRRDATRTAGDGAATLALPEGDADPVVWETTEIDTLATVRGTLRAAAGEAAPTGRAARRAGGDRGRTAGLALVEAPVPAGRAAERLHRCVAHEDGAGGFTVVCTMRAHATAANVTDEEASADVWTVDRLWGTVVRMDLPASPSGFEARVLGYSAGVEGVVLRAEASRTAGEERPVITLLAAERAQPQVPRAKVKYLLDCNYGCFGSYF